nr:AAA family ATPase [uncultured Dyadobacter sp.]
MSIAIQLMDYFVDTDIVPLRGRDDLICCTRRDAHGMPYQIIYIDESTAWLRDDVGAYLEEILSDNYYTCENYLQWNFYYYFLSEPQEIADNREQKLHVERDEAFARKFILTPVDFIQQLASVKNIGETDGLLESGDLYSDWLNYLQDNGLHFVYDEKQYPNYKAWVEQYIEGRIFGPPVEDVQPRATRQVASVSSVSRLSLTEFRAFPEQRSFKFGKVNLIFGPNASGKTSFFDALELCFTGQAKRADAQGYRLDATTGSGDPLGFPAEAGAYRQRDIAWYKNVYTRGHNLPNNFNKFNYYASDAAFLLQSDDEKGENAIESTITDIVLGREINRLEERINEFCTRFENRYEELKKIQQEQQTELHSLESREVQIRQENSDPAIYRKPVADFLLLHGWQVESRDDDTFLVNVENAIRLVSDCLEQLTGKFPAGTVLTIKDIDAQQRALREKASQLASFRKDQDESQQLLRVAQQEILHLLTLTSVAGDLARYHTDPNIGQLEVIDDLLKEAVEGLEKQEKAAALLQQLLVFITSQPEDVSAKKFFEYQAEKAQLKIDTSSELSNATAESERIRRGVELLTAIVADIKRLGMDYLVANHKADQCPLCQTGYSHEQLRDRIATSAALLGNAENYTTQQKEIARLESIIEECDRIATQVDELETAIPYAYLDLTDTLTFAGLRDQLQKDIAAIPQQREALVRLRVIKASFEEKGLSRERFAGGKAELEGFLKMTVDNEEELSAAAENLQRLQHALSSRIEKIQTDIETVKQRSNTLFDQLNPDDEAIQNNLRELEKFKGWINQIATVIRLVDSQDLLKLRNDVQQLRSLYEVYHSAWKDRREQSKALEILEVSIAEVKDRKRSNDLMLGNAKSGFDLLLVLMTEKNKRSYLVDFMNRNKREMVNIFKQIHAPMEFTDISFDNQKLKLLDGENRWHTINEVSTGQRTAIALSLFLSLNQKLTRGPDVILLDDPVTYVDDLNTLSFLDYLRELIERTERQVFFATANADVAFLFSKKFAYLPEGKFCRFEFKRSY